MQLIDQDLGRRQILSPDQSSRILAAIEDGRLSIDPDESLDFDGDLVVGEDDYRECLRIARIIR